ncbi:hypothetical protein L1987_63683 [Smallanthus sonchifolius]|uniref:Uncharacterized protein n=1 Tax=Smallanthus sonchifolius TaxID=185202 RepID=A0ACB9CE06_9ASTR|nr:hypothetical protein L1987_63683 [Smallanthus sonchifolius]
MTFCFIQAIEHGNASTYGNLLSSMRNAICSAKSGMGGGSGGGAAVTSLLTKLLSGGSLADPIVPDALEGGHTNESVDFKETESDESDPYAGRIRAAYNKITKSASGGSKRLKMIARMMKKKKKTKGPHPESSSQRKRKTVDTNKDYNPADDLDPLVTMAKKAKASVVTLESIVYDIIATNSAQQVTENSHEG